MTFLEVNDILISVSMCHYDALGQDGLSLMKFWNSENLSNSKGLELSFTSLKTGFACNYFCIQQAFLTNSCNQKWCRQHFNCKKSLVLLLLLMRKSRAVCIFMVLWSNSEKDSLFPLDTGRKLNAHKTFRRRLGLLLNVLCAFSLRLVSRGFHLVLFLTERGKTTKYKWGRSSKL